MMTVMSDKVERLKMEFRATRETGRVMTKRGMNRLRSWRDIQQPSAYRDDQFFEATKHA
jgi:hypothetical protein